MNEGFFVLNNPEAIRLQLTGARPIPCINVGCSDGVTPPPSVTRGVAKDETYTDYRLGLDGACVDIIITTKRPDGKQAVLLSKRSTTKCFGGLWWIHGGALHAYRPIGEFIVERAARECGAKPTIRAFVGVARTCSAGVVGSTIQPCYLGTVEFQDLNAIVDPNHGAVRLFTLSEYRALPQSERYWYVDEVVEASLTALQE